MDGQKLIPAGLYGYESSPASSTPYFLLFRVATSKDRIILSLAIFKLVY
jgi:hypothetical protein